MCVCLKLNYGRRRALARERSALYNNISALAANIFKLKIQRGLKPCAYLLMLFCYFYPHLALLQSFFEFRIKFRKGGFAFINNILSF
jgi:hypothetical protein